MEKNIKKMVFPMVIIFVLVIICLVVVDAVLLWSWAPKKRTVFADITFTTLSEPETMTVMIIPPSEYDSSWIPVVVVDPGDNTVFSCGSQSYLEQFGRPKIYLADGQEVSLDWENEDTLDWESLGWTYGQYLQVEFSRYSLDNHTYITATTIRAIPHD
jgi:hypothetical protein